MALLKQHFKADLSATIAEYLEKAFDSNLQPAIVGRTVSIGYKNGLYYVSHFDLKEKYLTTTSYRYTELDKAVAYFLELYWLDPIGQLDPEDAIYVTPNDS